MVSADPRPLGLREDGRGCEAPVAPLIPAPCLVRRPSQATASMDGLFLDWGAAILGMRCLVRLSPPARPLLHDH